jgi:hypothetical protein
MPTLILRLIILLVAAPLCSQVPDAQNPKGETGHKKVTAADLGVRVSRVLDEYIAVEDDLWTAKKSFEKGNFAGHSAKLRSLDDALLKVRGDASRLPVAPAEASEFKAALVEYVRQLRTSISALQGISARLVPVAKGDLGAYSDAEYLADVQRYMKLREGYMASGRKLNEAFRRLPQQE